MAKKRKLTDEQIRVGLRGITEKLREVARLEGVYCIDMEKTYAEESFEDKCCFYKIFYFHPQHPDAEHQKGMSMSLDGFADFEVGKRYRIVIEEVE